MSRVAILAAAVLSAGVALTAGEASAQAAPADGQAAGLRYLAWNGHSGPPATPTASTPATAAGGSGLRRPNLVIPHGGFSAVAPAPVHTTAAAGPGLGSGLTPANAWMRRPAGPEPAAPPDAVRAAAPPSAPLPVARILAPPAPPARPTPDYLPNQGGRGQPAPAEAVYAPAPPPAAEGPAFDPADPMAPRRDAPVFRMQRSAAASPAEAPAAAPAPTPAPDRTAVAPAREAAPVRVATVTPNTADRPTVEGARYYSVHRQNGGQPDPIAMPEPTYVDAMAISVPESLASQDLAQPAEPPTLIRDSQGRLRAAPAASDGDHQ